VPAEFIAEPVRGQHATPRRRVGRARSGGDRRPTLPTALDLSDPESLAVGNYFLDTRFGGLERDIAALTEVERHQKGGKDAG
jgi:hypothetical protein